MTEEDELINQLYLRALNTGETAGNDLCTRAAVRIESLQRQNGDLLAVIDGYRALGDHVKTEKADTPG